jgi:hypothetical protein
MQSDRGREALRSNWNTLCPPRRLIATPARRIGVICAMRGLFVCPIKVSLDQSESFTTETRRHRGDKTLLLFGEEFPKIISDDVPGTLRQEINTAVSAPLCLCGEDFLSDRG